MFSTTIDPSADLSDKFYDYKVFVGNHDQFNITGNTTRIVAWTSLEITVFLSWPSVSLNSSCHRLYTSSPILPSFAELNVKDYLGRYNVSVEDCVGAPKPVPYNINTEYDCISNRTGSCMLTMFPYDNNDLFCFKQRIEWIERVTIDYPFVYFREDFTCGVSNVSDMITVSDYVCTDIKYYLKLQIVRGNSTLNHHGSNISSYVYYGWPSQLMANVSGLAFISSCKETAYVMTHEAFVSDLFLGSPALADTSCNTFLATQTEFTNSSSSLVMTFILLFLLFFLITICMCCWFRQLLFSEFIVIGKSIKKKYNKIKDYDESILHRRFRKAKKLSVDVPKEPDARFTMVTKHIDKNYNHLVNKDLPERMKENHIKVKAILEEPGSIPSASSVPELGKQVSIKWQDPGRRSLIDKGVKKV
jgi:hypothetical protein